MKRRFAAIWCAALGIAFVCLCATSMPYWQPGYPRWDGEAYFSSAPDLVDINTAPAAELQTLPGIGEKKAQAIVTYRAQHGPFLTVEQLDDVDGISPRMVDAMRALIWAS